MLSAGLKHLHNKANVLVLVLTKSAYQALLMHIYIHTYIQSTSLIMPLLTTPSKGMNNALSAGM